jgi:hypothetical protein
VKRQAAIFLCGAALLVVYVLHGVVNPWADRLPGIDSGNLYAWEVYTRSVLADGHLPFWNPYQFAGTPHLADPQTTVLYPPALLLRWLPVPAFLGWMMALHLWIAGAGTLFAARVLGLGWLAASASAVAVMLGGSAPGWIHDGHLLLLYSVAWVPLAFGLAVVSIRSGRLVPDGRLVAVLVLQFLSGYLQGTLYVGAALAFFYLFSVVWPEAVAKRWTPLGQLVVLGLLCACAAAFLLLPAATLILQSGRSGGLSYQEALTGSWQIRDLTTLLFPFYGVTDDPPYRYLADRLAYVGWILTACAPFAFFRRERLRVAVFLALVVAGVCLLALGDAGGLFRLQYALFPGLRVPGRVLFVATFSLALLGGIGLEAFLALAMERRWRLVMPAAVSSAMLAAATTIVLSGPRAAAAGPGWPWMPVALTASILAVAVAALFRWQRVALVIALSAVVVDVTALNAGAVSTVPIEAESNIRQWIGPPDGGRAISLCESRVSAREFLQARESTLDGLPGLHLRGYADWAYLAKTGEVPRGGLYYRVGSEGETPKRQDLIDMASVTRIVTCTHDASGEITGLAVQRNARAWPRAVWVCSGEDVSRREAIAHIIRGRYDAAGRLEPRRYMKVRWAPGVDKTRQEAVERAHHLEAGVRLEGTTWRYLLGDASTDAVLAIMRDPEVEDTHGVDRATGAFTPTGELQDSVPEIAGGDVGRVLLPGPEPCADLADVNVTVMDRPDGRVSAHVNARTDGFLFFSEPSYPERKATIDGRPVPAVRANLAFTAVSVPAGEHDVELRYRPSSFYLGSLISGATAAAYAVVFLRRPRRKDR